MVTYDTLIQFGLLIVAIIGLVYKIAKKINRPSPKLRFIFCQHKGNRYR